MRTVLIVMPQFIPSSYPPAHRVRFFTNHLEEFGWKSVVLTVEPQYLEEAPDWEFAGLVSNDLEIIRTRAFPCGLTRKMGIGDLGIRALWFHLREARRICRERKIDLLFIPGPPWHTFLVGPRIKREFGIPFVIDYIDPWVSSCGEDGRFWAKDYWFRRMAMKLEPAVAGSVDHVVAVSDGTSDGVRERYPCMSSDMFTGIPYGGEQGDFDFIRANPADNPFFSMGDANFNFVYIGAMLPKAYDTLRALFMAVKSICVDYPQLYSKMRLHFIGTTYAADPRAGLVEPVAKEMGLQDIVVERPKRVPYMTANTVLTQANCILGLGTTETHYTASKIYPCILAERPLIAIYHALSSVTDVMRETNAGELITYTTEAPVDTRVSLIRDALLKVMDPGYVKPVVNWQGYERYSARSMTEKLAEVFDNVVRTAVVVNGKI
ncbi:MAG: glycosyltransferase [bacterium]|nr:glycosyltransferase [bacterium]